jgi:hypothetical protein
MNAIVMLGLAAAAGGGYWWWSRNHAVKTNATFLDPTTGNSKTVPTDFAVDAKMDEFQRKEALSVALGVIGGQDGTQQKAFALHAYADAYRKNGLPVTAKTFDDTAKWLEGGAYPPWYAAVQAQLT